MFDALRPEVNQDTKSKPCGLEIRKQLLFEKIIQRGNSLQLKDDFTVNHQIKAVCPQGFTFIEDGNCFLLLKRNVPLF